MALAGLVSQDCLAISAIEHPSIAEPALRLKKRGVRLNIINVDNNGLIPDATIDMLVKEKPNLVSIMLANNETGVIQNLAPFAWQLRANDIKVHSDAVQALGKIPVSFKQLGVHLMSLSSHKIYGPKGCGALVFEKGVNINPLFLGGDQEQGLRAGTENAAAIVGFGKAAELAQIELAQRNEYMTALRVKLEESLTCIPGLTIFARQANRLPNTVQIGIPGIDGEMLLMKLDQHGIAVSSGSACASGGNMPSPLLMAMGVEAGLAKSAIRISLGMTNTATEIYEFINVLKDLVYQA